MASKYKTRNHKTRVLTYWQIRLIEKHIERGASLASIAKKYEVSYNVISRLFHLKLAKYKKVVVPIYGLCKDIPYYNLESDVILAVDLMYDQGDTIYKASELTGEELKIYKEL